jgi:hypothetical protein
MLGVRWNGGSMSKPQRREERRAKGKKSVARIVAQAVADFCGASPKVTRSENGKVTYKWKGVHRKLNVLDGKGSLTIGELVIEEDP